MSEEQLKAFLEAVKADPALYEKLNAAEDLDAVVSIASAAGFIINLNEIKKVESELSEDELESLAGGNASGVRGCTIIGCALRTGCILGKVVSLIH